MGSAVDIIIVLVVVAAVAMVRLVSQGKTADAAAKALFVEQQILDLRLVFGKDSTVASVARVDGVWGGRSCEFEFVQGRLLVREGIFVGFILAYAFDDLNFRRVRLVRRRRVRHVCGRDATHSRTKAESCSIMMPQ